jgi:hypothetical protein
MNIELNFTESAAVFSWAFCALIVMVVVFLSGKFKRSWNHGPFATMLAVGIVGLILSPVPFCLIIGLREMINNW